MHTTNVCTQSRNDIEVYIQNNSIHRASTLKEGKTNDKLNRIHGIDNILI